MTCTCGPTEFVRLGPFEIIPLRIIDVACPVHGIDGLVETMEEFRVGIVSMTLSFREASKAIDEFGALLARVDPP